MTEKKLNKIIGLDELERTCTNDEIRESIKNARILTFNIQQKLEPHDITSYNDLKIRLESYLEMVRNQIFLNQE